ncbi:uncharacterized protein [Anabrus simplex]|uniref:uncharacterized protein n=1 Tax=Anabrus simplex TaxID=316456 RepID=UPI0035A3C555
MKTLRMATGWPYLRGPHIRSIRRTSRHVQGVRLGVEWNSCSRDLVAAKIKLGNWEGPREITIGSVYLPYDSTDPSPSEDVEELICKAKRKGEHLVLRADANAHHTAWGSTNCNARDRHGLPSEF